MEQWQIEVAERLARIEANQEYMKDGLKSLPQSEQCVKDIAELKGKVKELQVFQSAIKEKIAYIGGVIVIIGMAIPYTFQWIMSHIHWRTP
jgi:lipid II:glycine glycyltransferase (peptidoglycan interpeptide bridge formation enzyme)